MDSTFAAAPPAVPLPGEFRPPWRWLAVAAGLLAAWGLGSSLMGPVDEAGVESRLPMQTHATAGRAAVVQVSTTHSAAGDDSLALAESRVTAMVDSLAERMQQRPADAEGWQSLGRSYASLGRHAQALEAYRHATQLHPNDATLLAEQAFSAAVIEPRAAEGEPARLLERALGLEPKNEKALALAGTLALDRRDYAAAVQYWEQLARALPADSAMARQVQGSIGQARQLAGGLRN